MMSPIITLQMIHISIAKTLLGIKKMMILEKGKALQLLSNMQYYLSKQTIMCALLFNDFGLSLFQETWNWTQRFFT